MLKNKLTAIKKKINTQNTEALNIRNKLKNSPSVSLLILLKNKTYHLLQQI